MWSCHVQRSPSDRGTKRGFGGLWDRVVIEGGPLMGQLDKMLVPDPSDLVSGVILILGEPKLTLFTNDIEDLIKGLAAEYLETPSGRDLPRQLRRSGRDTQPLCVHDQC